MILTVSSKESDGGALTTGTSRTTDTVNIVFRIVWVIIVEHMSNVLDVLKRTKLVYPC